MSREIDADVAAKIMGWEHIEQHGPLLRGVTIFPPHGKTWLTVPEYSSDMAAAWGVVTELRKRGYQVEIRSVFGTFHWTCVIEGHGLSAITQHLSVEYAICDAALAIIKAVGGASVAAGGEGTL